jgi:hypothetical protein
LGLDKSIVRERKVAKVFTSIQYAENRGKREREREREGTTKQRFKPVVKEKCAD